MLAWQQIVSNLPLLYIQGVLIGERFGSRRSAKQKIKQEPRWTEGRHLAFPQSLLGGFHLAPHLSAPHSPGLQLMGEGKRLNYTFMFARLFATLCLQ